jgi:hypothetical protein
MATTNNKPAPVTASPDKAMQTAPLDGLDVTAKTDGEGEGNTVTNTTPPTNDVPTGSKWGDSPLLSLTDYVARANVSHFFQGWIAEQAGTLPRPFEAWDAYLNGDK